MSGCLSSRRTICCTLGMDHATEACFKTEWVFKKLKHILENDLQKKSRAVVLLPRYITGCMIDSYNEELRCVPFKNLSSENRTRCQCDLFHEITTVLERKSKSTVLIMKSMSMTTLGQATMIMLLFYSRPSWLLKGHRNLYSSSNTLNRRFVLSG